MEMTCGTRGQEPRWASGRTGTGNMKSSPFLAYFYAFIQESHTAEGLSLLLSFLDGWKIHQQLPSPCVTILPYADFHFLTSGSGTLQAPREWKSCDINMAVGKQPHVLEMCWVERATKLYTSREHCSLGLQWRPQW